MCLLISESWNSNLLRLIHTLKPDVFETYVQCKHFQPKKPLKSPAMWISNSSPALTRHGPGDLLEMIHLRQLSTTNGSKSIPMGRFRVYFPSRIYHKKYQETWTMYVGTYTFFVPWILYGIVWLFDCVFFFRWNQWLHPWNQEEVVWRSSEVN